jgi:hypothetical protein
VASLVGRVQDLVVEDGEIEGEAQTDGVSGSQVGGGDLSGALVSLEGQVGGALALLGDGELGKVAVVVSLPVEMLAMYSKCDLAHRYILW